MKKLVALALSAVMALSLFSGAAFAAEGVGVDREIQVSLATKNTKD